MSKYVNDKQLDFLEWYVSNRCDFVLQEWVTEIIKTRCVQTDEISLLNSIRQNHIEAYLKREKDIVTLERG
jgi:hypothetical protein